MERWKDIPGFEGLYQASDHGNIRTCAGKVTSNARFQRRVWKQRILKQKYQHRHSNKTNGFDARVSLWKDGKENTCLVSRLVAMTWCDGYEDGMTVNHVDGNPMNNHSENLEWISIGENIRKGFDDMLFSTQKPIALVDNDGNMLQFRSMACASRYLCKNNGYISCLLARGITQTKDGFKILASF